MNNNTYGLTLEIEQAHQTNIHFLDIDIKVEESVIHTAVYHKLGTKGIYIPVGSCDPPQYKVAPFKALIKRAHTHSSTEPALQSELRSIQRIAAEHGYSKLVRKLWHEYQNTTQDLPLREERQDMDKIIPVNYNPYIRRLYGEIAKKNHIRIAYRRCASIFNILTNGKDQPDKDKLSGVYSIPIIDRRCDKNLLYVGSTKRSLEVRLKEHAADIQKQRNTTALAVYASDPDIYPEFKKARIIRTARTLYQMARGGQHILS
ncbi:uncharacterized protein LOC111616934 [Centruroides sculpturatus]|uniref:uncharacterized protein LOC111616934 n=1 Tax=Centruroides sculpturatus TaxID=218467 RepID=UPI000C6E1017|nr:uncharacterized protein LOC111616934 [Centruroides sculpturatus]